MSPEHEWHCTVDRMIAKLRGDPDAIRLKVLENLDCKRAHSLFEIGGDPNEIRRLLTRAIQEAKKHA